MHPLARKNHGAEGGIRTHESLRNSRQIVSILEHSFWLKKEGYRESTIQSAVASLKALSKTSNLMNPEEIKENIANREVTNGTKKNWFRFMIGSVNDTNLAGISHNTIEWLNYPMYR